MRLSRKGEYACIAMLDLAERYGEDNVRTSDICRGNSIPQKYLEQILLLLSRAGMVHSSRGRKGGHALARKPSQITIAQIVRLVDGPLAPVESVSKYFYHHTPIEQKKGLVRLFRDIRNMVSDKLEHTTLADLVQ